MPFDYKEYDKQYKKNNYDTLTLRLPKGLKPEIEAAAAAKSLSIAKYITALVKADINKAE